jgi:hypothetical protein
VTSLFPKSCRIRSELETASAGAGAAQPANKKSHGGKSSDRGSIRKRWASTVEKAVMRRRHPGIVAKIESRGGGHTIVFSRSRLNAFFFGFRLAWLSPSQFGVIEVFDLTALLSAVGGDL